MRTMLFVATLVVVWLPAARAQSGISIEESKIRAILVQDSTVVGIPVTSKADHPVKATLALAWLDRSNREASTTSHEVSVQPGTSSLDIPFAIGDSSIWTRLRYTLTPDRTEARLSAPVSGIVALSQIASHVFEMRIAYTEAPQRGRPVIVHAEAVHPVSRLPITGVAWEAALSIDGRKLTPLRISSHDEGFVDFTFDIPASASNDSDAEATIEISGRRGDFAQSASAKLPIPSRMSAQLQSDKPIYQPGQILHLRAVVQNAEGKAADGAKLSLRIEDSDNERAHTADLVASRFGIAQDDWTIPASAGPGTYRIILTAEGDSDYQIGNHVIRVSRYDLPAFSVTAQPDRNAYLPTQQPKVTITGTYLFGKPVPNGQVKIVRTEEPRFGSKPAKSEDGEKTVAEGTASADGQFVADLDIKSDQQDFETAEDQRFRDFHFAAYYKDVTSGRTEQRRFDIRITHEPIHIYLISTYGTGSLPSPVYVSTSYADGKPASATVSISFRGQTTSLHTNRYGVGKALMSNLLANQDDDDHHGPNVTATDAAGQTGHLTEPRWPPGDQFFRIEPDKVIHRQGEAITLSITTPPESRANQFVLIAALSDEHELASQIAHIENHKGQVTFPYQPDFRRTLVFAAWNAVNTDANEIGQSLGSVAAIFPDASDLRISTSADRPSYKPGERVSLNTQVTSADGKPVAAALGLAVVDQAVMERARTDSDFGSRPWFSCAFCNNPGEDEIGGVRLNDLYALKPATPVSPDLELVAEALIARTGSYIGTERSESLLDAPAFASISAQMKQWSAAFDRRYTDTLNFPDDFSALAGIFGQRWYQTQDPWGQPYSAVFSIEGTDRVMTLVSSGPDKRSGTDDDIVVQTFRRPFFTPVRSLMEQILKKQQDYPASDAEFARLMSNNGLLMSGLRDPWNTPYRAEVTTMGAMRRIAIVSAGPDQRFGTADDVAVDDFSGSYFRREASEINKVVSGADPAPQTVDDFETVLGKSGVDVAGYRDAWGRPYRIASVLSSRYADRVDSKTVQVFGGPASSKTDILPVTQKFITFSLRSDGPDGVSGTYDDFDIARFPVLLQEESAQQETNKAPGIAVLSPGTGAIFGIVTDASGAVVPKATITLFGAAQIPYETSTDAAGIFHFVSVPVGTYSVKAFSMGFKLYEVTQMPVASGKTTGLDIQLQLGNVSESISVEADVAPLQTESSELLAPALSSTPRVREYFPETLLWIPELDTDANGRAHTELTLADTVTTWKIAAFASTMDGRTVEAESDLRAFQPFFLDFNPPQILTQGDQIDLPVIVRNYQNRAQNVNVATQPADWLTIQGSSTRQVTVPAGNSATVTYPIQAKTATDNARSQLTASASRDRDSIAKVSKVHPDGQEVTQTFGDLLSGNSSLTVKIPQAAIVGANRAELRLYPNLMSMLLESSQAILETPHGCAEQTISAGYANLIALRFARASGITDPLIEKRALDNIRLAVDGLTAFGDYEGGVSYWATGNSDVAVTAYALNFLIDASAVTSVQKDRYDSLVSWLEKHQAKDGTWLPRDSGIAADRQALVLTSTVAKALGAAQKAGVKVSSTALAGAYHHIAKFTDSTDEPYMLANFVLASLDSGDETLLGNAVSRLAGLGHEERGSLYWDLQTNSPFYGWGTAGRFETTGLVVSALSCWRAAHPESSFLDSPIKRGLVFLLHGRDGAGGWLSTQATVRAMAAFADASASLGGIAGHAGKVEVRANGHMVKTVDLPDDAKATDPILINMSPFLAAGENQISFAPSAGAESAVIRLTATHWLPWEHTTARTSPELRLAVHFDRLEAKVGEPIRCSVKAERVGFRGYGMMLAEIGLPPGAEVDRASLESVIEDGTLGLDHYEILPDKVVMYLWPKAGGAAFDFFLSARMAMQAKSAASTLYDYYNPEALSELAPFQWNVK